MRILLLKVLLAGTFLFGSFSASSQYNLDRMLAEGRSLLGANRFTEAMAKFDFLLEYKQNDFQLFFFRGVCKFYLEDITGAAADFNSCIINNPFFTEGYHLLGLCRDRQDDYEQAILYYNKALSLDTVNARVYLDRALARLNAHQYCNCIDDCEKAVFLKISDKETAYLCKASCEENIGDHETALLDYGRALQIDPFNPATFVRRAIVKQKLKKYTEAEEDFNRALKMDSVNVFALFNKALMKMDAQDYPAALLFFNRVIKLDNRNSLALYNRSIAYISLNKKQNAIEDLNKVLAISDQNIIALMQRASIYMSMEKYKDAVKDYNRVLELFPYNVQAYYTRSAAKQQLGDQKGAYLDKATGKSIGEMNHYKSDASRKNDSLLYVKLSRFKGGFENNETSLGRIQNKQTEIHFLEPFRVCINDTSRKIYFSLELERFNKQNDTRYKLSNGKAFIAKRFTGNEKFELFNKAISLSDSSFYSAADSLYTRILLGDSNFVWARFNYVVSLCSQQQMQNNFEQKPNTDNYELALRQLKHVLRQMPSFAYAYYNRAYIYTYLQNYNGAVDSYSKAIELAPNLAEAYYNRALVFLLLKDNDHACADLSRAGELGIHEAYSVIKKFCN